MSPLLRDLIEAAILPYQLALVRDSRKQSHEGFVPDHGEPTGFSESGALLATRGTYMQDVGVREARQAGELALRLASEQLRRAMFAIGKACLREPSFGANTQINEGTFHKLFGDSGSELLKEMAAIEGFRNGIAAAKKA
jgi:hypothetical protein